MKGSLLVLSILCTTLIVSAATAPPPKDAAAPEVKSDIVNTPVVDVIQKNLTSKLNSTLTVKTAEIIVPDKNAKGGWTYDYK